MQGARSERRARRAATTTTMGRRPGFWLGLLLATSLGRGQPIERGADGGLVAPDGSPLSGTIFRPNGALSRAKSHLLRDIHWPTVGLSVVGAGVSTALVHHLLQHDVRGEMQDEYDLMRAEMMAQYEEAQRAQRQALQQLQRQLHQQARGRHRSSRRPAPRPPPPSPRTEHTTTTASAAPEPQSPQPWSAQAAFLANKKLMKCVLGKLRVPRRIRPDQPIWISGWRWNAAVEKCRGGDPLFFIRWDRYIRISATSGHRMRRVLLQPPTSPAPIQADADPPAVPADHHTAPDLIPTAGRPEPAPPSDPGPSTILIDVAPAPAPARSPPARSLLLPPWPWLTSSAVQAWRRGAQLSRGLAIKASDALGAGRAQRLVGTATARWGRAVPPPEVLIREMAPAVRARR
ncbi:MAG: hypothetical protein M1826_001963 [Phylliscum demangeonii]|nr:MAG: hypothetical protein M1826_001963 [Phylliscum demangeonii]